MAQKTVLDNGVRLLSETLPQAYSVALGLWVEVGSRDEPASLGGVSHFIEHMAFKGTARRDALTLAREIDRLGGHANAFTGKENTCFHARALAEHLPELGDILCDILLHPSYDPVELERERQVILQELSFVDDSPDELVHVLFSEAFWPGHALGRPILGTAETVGNLGRQAMLDYMDANYSPANLVVAAVGAVDHQRLVALLGDEFNALPTRPFAGRRTSPAVKPGLLVVRRDLEQVQVAMGAPAPANASPERFAAALLNTILGGSMSSRLFQEVRERRGLAYSIYSYLSSYSDVGMLGVSMGVAPDKAAEALAVALDEMERLAQPGAILHEELAHAKDHLKGSILLSAENPESRMSRLARNEFTFGRAVPMEEVIANIEAVEMEQLTALARDGLARNRLGVTVLGAVDETPLAKELGL